MQQHVSSSLAPSPGEEKMNYKKGKQNLASMFREKIGVASGEGRNLAGGQAGAAPALQNAATGNRLWWRRPLGFGQSREGRQRDGAMDRCHGGGGYDGRGGVGNAGHKVHRPRQVDVAVEAAAMVFTERGRRAALWSVHAGRMSRSKKAAR